MEDDGERMLFAAVRRNLNRIAGDVGLLARGARRLQAKGRERLPRRLGGSQGDRGAGVSTW